MKRQAFLQYIIFAVIQCTWGAVQNLLGILLWLILALTGKSRRPVFYHGAWAMNWPFSGSMGMGMFIFMGCGQRSDAEQVMVHEFGHTLQSAILGPFYLLAIGLPSVIWALSPFCIEKRKNRKIRYVQFYPERWANLLGEKALGQPGIQA